MILIYQAFIETKNMQKQKGLDIFIFPLLTVMKTFTNHEVSIRWRGYWRDRIQERAWINQKVTAFLWCFASLGRFPFCLAVYP